MDNVLLYINNNEINNKIIRELRDNYNIINTYLDSYNYLRIINQYNAKLIIIDYHDQNDYLLLSRLISSKVLIIYIRNDLVEVEDLKKLNNFLCVDYFNVNKDYINLALKDFKIINELNNKIDEYKDKEEMKKLVNKAKLKLIKNGLSEEEAYNYILKESMNLRITKKELALKILND